MWDEVITTLIFYVISIPVVMAALFVVTTSRILRSAIFLAVVLLGNAGLFVLLGFEFLAGVQVLVYIGGIVVLLVFAIMLTSSADYSENEPSPHRKFWGIVAAVSFFAIVVTAVSTTEFALQSRPAVIPPEIVALGHHLLDYGPNGYVLPFEIISLLLLSVLIGGIIIARKFPQVKDIPEVK